MIALAAPGSMELLVVLFIAVFTVFPFWFICSKAGFPGWISLAVLIPVLNLLLLFFLAFSDWPALRQVPSSDDRR